MCISFGAQALAYSYSTFGREVPTEHYYDLSGAMTHVALVAHAITTSAVQNNGVLNPRAVLMGGLSSIWAIRLGSYLYDRVGRTGGDVRFDELKKDARLWTVPWLFQAVWCWALEAPLAMVAASRIASSRTLTRWDGVGAAVFLGGLLWEAIADSQKDAFKRVHKNEPMMEGLFRYSVYPSYFGEVTLWCGATLLALPAAVRPWQILVAALPPAFDAYLLWCVSGIPLSERASWAKYGTNSAYCEYRARTSLFFPWPQEKGAISKERMGEVMERVAKLKVKAKAAPEAKATAGEDKKKDGGQKAR